MLTNKVCVIEIIHFQNLTKSLTYFDSVNGSHVLVRETVHLNPK
jgi:hypothetical protein